MSHAYDWPSKHSLHLDVGTCLYSFDPLHLD